MKVRFETACPHISFDMRASGAECHDAPKNIGRDTARKCYRVFGIAPTVAGIYRLSYFHES
jgi:hypothetical protein